MTKSSPFLILYFIFSTAVAAQTSTYQVFSLDDQFVVYSQNPDLAQNGALKAEAVRRGLFEELGWVNYSEFPTQIWLIDPDKEQRYETKMVWQGNGWAKKITLPAIESINDEILPREVIRLFLREFALDKNPKIKKSSPNIPLWLVEGYRLKMDIRRESVPTSNLLIGLDEVFHQKVPFKDGVRQAQFAELAEKFLAYLLELPEGRKKMKTFIRALAHSKDPEKVFFSVYSDQFKNFQQLKFAWNEKWIQKNRAEEERKTDRRQVILEYLDSLESE